MPYEFPLQDPENRHFEGICRIQTPKRSESVQRKALPKERLLCLSVRCVLSLDDRRVLAAVPIAEASPARPEDERDDQANDADHDKNDACDLDVDPGDFSVHGPCQDRTNCDQQDAQANSHLFATSFPPRGSYVVQAAKYPEMRGV